MPAPASSTTRSRDFTKAVQIDPNSGSAYNNRALAYRQTGRNDAALADFSKAIAADPNYGPAYIGRANVLRAQGDLDGASLRPQRRRSA